MDKIIYHEQDLVIAHIEDKFHHSIPYPAVVVLDEGNQVVIRAVVEHTLQQLSLKKELISSR